MQFIDLKTQYRNIENDVRQAIEAVLEHGQFIMGPEVGQLEEQLADWVGAKHSISCASGTDALQLVLMAQNIGPGDCVFTSAFSFFASAEVISLLGATPVFVDIDPGTLNIDVEKLALAIKAVKANDPSIYPLPVRPDQNLPLEAKAVIPVDIFGLPADYDPLMELAKREGLFVLEDAAQSFGGSYKGRSTGSLGHAGATSFFPAKPLGGYGDGGAVFTDDEEVAAKIKSIRNHGMGSDRYDHVRLGLNSRLDTIQAAVLLQKLKVFGDEVAKRQEIAERYANMLSGYELQVIPTGYVSAWAQFSLLTDKREHLQEELLKQDIPTMVYYPKGLHHQGVYQSLQYGENDFPVTDSVCRRIMSLPMHPYLDEESQERICRVFKQAV
ncbi:MAG: DegT/DnrJ/EryC1/StrS family aminotransferase [Desulfocapsaceae bacterium]|nr:DegT/DnrJ/EryC1/StrS family aminotransferase [Desulfocapsaceae bacterium]